MVKTVSDHDEPALEVDHAPEIEADTPLSDSSLLELLDALVEEQGRVPAARVLGVNYRTLANCCDTRRVSRRMRQALVAFRDAGGVDDGSETEEQGDILAQRVAELELENAGLRELVAERERELGELRRQMADLQGAENVGGADDASPVEVGLDPSDVQRHDWRPPRRQPGMPDAGVVTLEEQPDEEHAFGPAAALLAEWRKLVNASGQSLSRVERLEAAVRRWELEGELLGEYRLTLPPDTHPLDDARRADQVRWRRETLAEARRQLGRARRARLLRRVVTLGLWRRYG